ncbi:hypothetical protein Arno162_66 [Pectobacterium phage Arno162]|jgi:hypothetical protein|uniref:Uncharacterized protein n=2 Tax=Arnovirus TaxID=3425109 RepID=A0A678ZK03_9CAUD|nr:hypothetical protein Arno162_66 [Pectobacterium phage Arno162]AZV02251.1 hypothetical protein Arno18_65 [Pectobacterium phage Arno18]
MVSFSYLPNGNIRFSTNTSDELLTELFKQFGQDMVFVPRSFVMKTVNNYQTSLTVTHVGNAPTLLNPSYEMYEISPLTRKLVSRDSEGFFAALLLQYREGYIYKPSTASLSFGSYVAFLSKIEGMDEPPPPPVINDVESFNLDVALSFQTKEELVAYCESYGIEIDKRKTLPKLQNWLKAKSLEG